MEDRRRNRIYRGVLPHKHWKQVNSMDQLAITLALAVAVAVVVTVDVVRTVIVGRWVGGQVGRRHSAAAVMVV